eukprot:gene10551-biopygen2243
MNDVNRVTTDTGKHTTAPQRRSCGAYPPPHSNNLMCAVSRTRPERSRAASGSSQRVFRSPGVSAVMKIAPATAEKE